jgi:hypothetical protein
VKALTLRQPWASLVMDGLKEFETRSWRPKIDVGERLVIHAAAAPISGPGLGVLHALAAEPRLAGVADPDIDAAIPGFPLGVILGSVRVIEILTTEEARQTLRFADAPWEQITGDFRDGRWAIRVAYPDVWPDQVAARGRLGLWEYEEGTGSPDPR